MAQALLKNRKFLVLVLIILLFLPNLAYLGNTVFVTETNNPRISDSISYTGRSKAPAAVVYFPPAPTNLSVVFSDGGVSLTWSQSYYSHYSAQDNIGYKIYRKESSAYGGTEVSFASLKNWTCIATINNNTYTDSAINESTTYYYAVSALAPGRESFLSDWVSIHTPSSIGPSPYPWWFALILIALGIIVAYGIYRFTDRIGVAELGSNESIPLGRSHISKLMRWSRIGGILGLVMLLTSIPGILVVGWFVLAAGHSSYYDGYWILFILLPMAVIQAAAGFLIFRNGKHIQNDIMRNRLSRARSRV